MSEKNTKAVRTDTDPEERVIALICGGSGQGKTFFIANLENAVVFDGDVGGGAEYAEPLLAAKGSKRYAVSTYGEVLTHLQNMVRKGEVPRHIVIDPITPLHQNAIIMFNPDGKRDFGHSGNLANREWQKIRKQINLMDCNFWVTSHYKSEWEDNEAIGKISDSAKNIEADMRVVIHLKRAPNLPWPGPNSPHGAVSTANVLKWRRLPTDPRGPVPASFPFTIENFMKVAGRGMSRETKQMVLPTAANLAEVEKLVEVLKVKDDGSLDKWFRNVGVERFEDAPQESILKLIEHLRSQIPKSIAA